MGLGRRGRGLFVCASLMWGWGGWFREIMGGNFVFDAVVLGDGGLGFMI